MIVYLLHQSLVRRAHGAPDFVAHEVRAFLLTPIRREHRMRALQFAGVAFHRRALLDGVARVIRRRGEIRPMRLDVRQVEHPRPLALRAGARPARVRYSPSVISPTESGTRFHVAPWLAT